MLEALFTYRYYSFSEEEALRSEVYYELWSPIVKAKEEDVDLQTGGKGIVRYMITKNLLLDFMQDHDDRAWAGRRRVALDTWLRLLAALLSMDGGYEDPVVLPQSG